MEPLRVLLVDDHALFREGLTLILNAEPDIEVVGEAEDGPAAILSACASPPDLILMDTSMPGGDGVLAIGSIKAALPHVIVIMLTGQCEQEKMVEALLAGADGYLLKSIRAQEMLDSIRGAFRREPLASPLAGHTLETFRQLGRTSALEGKLASLTVREREVVCCLGEGASNKEIAHDLHLSVNTVKTHMRHILEKLHIEGRRDAYAYARYLRTWHDSGEN